MSLMVWGRALPCLGLLVPSTAAIGASSPAVAARPVFRIVGTVVNRRDRTPVSHCRVTATQNVAASGENGTGPGPGEERGGGFAPGGFGGRSRRLPGGGKEQQDAEAVYSDEAGHFSLTVPGAGVWRLMGSARGFHTQSYEQQETFWSGIVLTAATPEMSVRFGLYADSSITGVVYDEAGEPVRSGLVRVEQVRFAAANEGLRRRPQVAVAKTDDRGRYEVPELNPGEYRVSVNAQPWYAAGRSGNQIAPSAGSAPDPSLDLVYAETWYPAAMDRESAETVILSAGEEREADFHLTPIPSIHLRIPAQPQSADGADGSVRRFERGPTVQRAEGSQGGGSISTTGDGREWDIGGLAPGKYQVRMPNAGSAGERLSTISVATGSPVVIGMTSAVAATTLAVTVDGVDGEDVRQVSLVDADSRQSFGTSGFGSSGREQTGGERDEDGQAGGGLGGERTITAPAGRYEVFLQGKPGLYLTGLTATGAKVEGRTIELGAGSPKLVVHAAIGLGEVEGVAKQDGKPVAGGMILLVPAGYGQTRNVSPLRRDETNTDGSFDLRGVFPGEYILVAIDHGWGVNWRDSATLDGYLTRGAPINLQPAATVQKTLEAVEP